MPALCRRHFFLGVLAAPAFAKKAAPERPNFLLVIVDDLPAWMLGCYGNREVRTPNLDRLAQTGARFANHFACAPASALGRATVLTGRTPMQLGDSEDPQGAGASFSKMVSAAGYAPTTSHLSSVGQYLAPPAAGKPFFHIAVYPDLHPPYEAAQKYRDLYAQAKFDTLNLDRTAAANASEGKEMLGDIIGNMRKVAAAVTALDDQVAVTLSKLSEKKVLDSTAVVFTSSCGALYGRHGLWDSGQGSEPINMYDEVLATPLIWSWLGHVPAQAVRPEMVSSYDLVPTLCDLLGAPFPGGNLCGRSYLPLATGKPLPKKQPWRTTVFAHLRNTDMARVEHYKLVVRDGGKGACELYDYTKDLGERVNQYANPQYLTVRNTLSQSLAGWKQRYSG